MGFFDIFHGHKKNKEVPKFDRVYTSILESLYHPDLTLSEFKLCLTFVDSDFIKLALSDDVSVLNFFGDRLYRCLSTFSYDIVTEKFTMHYPGDSTSISISQTQYVFGLACVIQNSLDERIRFWFSLYSSDGNSLLHSELERAIKENIVLYYYCHCLEEHLRKAGEALSSKKNHSGFENVTDKSHFLPSTNVECPNSPQIDKVVELADPSPTSGVACKVNYPIAKETSEAELVENKNLLQSQKLNENQKTFEEKFKKSVVNTILTEMSELSSNSIEDISEWMKGHEFPDSLACLLKLTIFSTIFLDKLVDNKFIAPLLRTSPSMKDSLISTAFSIWAISTFFSPPFEVWKLNYNSQIHGLSMNRFEYHVGKYEAPTLIFIHTTENRTFGAYRTLPWISSPKFKRDDRSFLFSLCPSTVIKRAIPEGIPNHVYFYTGNSSLSKLPSGMGFGGNLEDGFRLFLYNDLDGGMMRSFDHSFERGPISDKNEFSVSFIEVWSIYRKESTGPSQTEIKSNKKNMGPKDWRNCPERFIMDLAGRTRYSEAYENEDRDKGG